MRLTLAAGHACLSLWPLVIVLFLVQPALAQYKPDTKTYDDQGRIASSVDEKGTLSLFKYDDTGTRHIWTNGRLIGTEKADGTVIAYAYSDLTGKRIQKRTTKPGHAPEYFDYPQPKPREAVANGGAPVVMRAALTSSVPVLASVSPRIPTDSELLSPAPEIERDELNRITTIKSATGDTTTYEYFEDDARALIKAITYPTGNREEHSLSSAKFAYNVMLPFTQPLSLQAADDQMCATTQNRVAFGGYFYSCTTKTYLTPSGRMYDPAIGRFQQQDSYLGQIDDAPSLHRYTYAHNRPTYYTDPSGNAVYAFDGTRTNKDNPNLAKTNIGRIVEAAPVGVYEKGVGADWWSKHVGGATGLGATDRVEHAYKQLVAIYNGQQGEPDTTIDIFGFSRGSAEARQFANVVHDRGIPDLSTEHRTIVDKGEKNGFETVVTYDNTFHPDIRFLGVFDTVASMGMPGDDSNPGFDLSIPSNVKTVRQAIARDEVRHYFPLSHVIDQANPGDPRIKEEKFPGVHSDVGGAYPDWLDRRALDWMVNEAVQAGVPLDVDRLNRGIKKEGIPIRDWAHDSRTYSEIREMHNTGTNPERQEYYYTNPMPLPDPHDPSAYVVQEGYMMPLTKDNR